MDNGKMDKNVKRYEPSQDWRWSEILYIALNRCLGFERQVAMRRQITAIAEKITSGSLRFETGSRGDGFSMMGSDYDYMMIRTDFVVLPSFKNSKTMVLRMDSSYAPPGYTFLEIEDLSRLNDLGKSLFSTVDGRHYLNSVMYRRHSVELPDTSRPFEHGPCWSYVNDIAEYDHASCIQCKHFPSEAYEWTQRGRLWPSKEIVSEIINIGCILVPVASRVPNPKKELEFRISFVLGERKLVHSLCHVHFLCYGLLKLFLKFAINKHEHLKDLLCSYFLKTILFYALENDPKMHGGNILECFQICLLRLILFVKEEKCPNYFIPENNMFAYRVFGEKQKRLLDLLLHYFKGPECLYEIPDVAISFLFFKTGINKGQDETIDYRLDICEEFECDKELVLSGNISGGGTARKMEIYHRVTKMYENYKTIDITWLMLRSFISHLNQDAGDIMMQTFLPKCTSNKKRYLAMLLFSEFFFACVAGDAARGWLIFATYLYKLGQVNHAIVISDLVLERFNDYTITYGNLPGGSIAARAKVYMDTICGHKYPLYRKIMTAWALDVSFEKDSTLVPEELEELCKSASPCLLIPPMFYAHFLLFLCYNLKSIQRKKLEHLQTLKSVALDEEQVPHAYEELVHRIIGICEKMM